LRIIHRIEQREQLDTHRTGLLAPAVAHLAVPELLLDDPKGRFDLGAHADLEVLNRGDDSGVDLLALTQRPAVARPLADVVPLHTESFTSLGCYAAP